MTTASAPVAPDIIPGLPPNKDVIKQTIIAAYKPVSGETCAINANAIASGTMAKATVSPLSKLILISDKFMVNNTGLNLAFREILD